MSTYDEDLKKFEELAKECPIAKMLRDRMIELQGGSDEVPEVWKKQHGIKEVGDE